MGGVVPIPLRFVLARLLRARSVRRPGALARARLFPAVPVGAGGWGGGAGRAPAPPSGGGRGDHPPCLGGWGPAPPRLAGRWGGWGGEGRAAASLLPLWGAARGSLPWLPSGALPPGVHVLSGSRGRPGGGGDEGRPVDRSPGGPFRPEPSLCPPPSGQWSWGGSWGARPPYCSGAPPCAAPRLRPRAAPARWRGLARRPRPLREQAAGGAGARGVQVQPHPPPPSRCGPFWGRGFVPSAPGRRRVAPVALKLGGGSVGGGLGGPLCRPPPPRHVGRRPAIRCLRRAPPGYTRAVGVAGRPRASGAARSAANGSVRRGGGGGGGGNPPAVVRAPAFCRPASEGAAPFALSCAPPVQRRSAAGGPGACGRFTGGACGGCGAPSPRMQRPLLGGVRSRRLFGLPPSALGPDGERGGGEWGGASGPLAPPPDGRGGAAWRSRPRGPAVDWGGASFPRPPLPRAGPSCRASLGPLVPPAVAARRWPAGGGREG